MLGSKLTEQYRYIGCELLELEADLGIYSSPSEYVRKQFQSSSVFVPTEVLESYLDDLLSAGVPYSRLGLGKQRSNLLFYLMIGGSFVFAVLIGLLAVHYGYSIITSLIFTCGLSFPLVLAAFCIPQVAFARRLKFARLVSAEIIRRRGGDGEGRLKNLIAPKIMVPGLSPN
jgi:hypothetical protein